MLQAQTTSFLVSIDTIFPRSGKRPGQPTSFNRVRRGIGRGQGLAFPWLPVLRLLGLLFGYLCLRRREAQVTATGVGGDGALQVCK